MRDRKPKVGDAHGRQLPRRRAAGRRHGRRRRHGVVVRAGTVRRRAHGPAERARRRRVAGRVLADDLLERVREHLPGEDLDVLLDVARLRSREAHDDLEELLAVGLALGHRQRPEALEVAPDAVLLLDREAHRDERFEQVDRVDARDVALALLLPPDAADADAVRGPLLRGDGLEGGVDGAAVLSPLELHEPPLGLPLVDGPVLRHRVEVALQPEHCLLRVHGVGVEALAGRGAGHQRARGPGRLRHRGRADERRVCRVGRRRVAEMLMLMLLMVVVVMVVLVLVLVLVLEMVQGVARPAGGCHGRQGWAVARLAGDVRVDGTPARRPRRLSVRARHGQAGRGRVGVGEGATRHRRSVDDRRLRRRVAGHGRGHAGAGRRAGHGAAGPVHGQVRPVQGASGRGRVGVARSLIVAAGAQMLMRDAFARRCHRLG